MTIPTLLEFHPPAWMREGLCAQLPPEMGDDWYPGGDIAAAKKLCGRCPVRATCAQDAFDRAEQWGVWGGLTERERRRLRNAKGGAA